MQSTFCDRCNNEIETEDRIESGWVCLVSDDGADLTYDLCPDCFEKFQDFLDSEAIAEAEPSTTGNDPTKAKIPEDSESPN